MPETKLACRLYDTPGNPAAGRRYDAVAHLVEVDYAGSSLWYGRLLDVPVATGRELEGLVNRPLAVFFEDRRQGLLWGYHWQLSATVPEGEEPPSPSEMKPERAHIFFVGLTSLAKRPGQ